ncbi:hypothetical protein [Flavobacterium sp. '19STA2R22 D10 B1']|uniref:hypothetical protein n=1 Tax=Flavobacterium aerium TaxID=3037261 RepID=UPI00278BE893|nr:hypothetical protein [Flavobacterium sp. '19STA2R22 D10 B1']
MSNSLLGNYSVIKSESNNYALDFEIPTNCQYSFDTDADTQYVKIQLNEGEKNPAATQQQCNVPLEMINNYINVTFIQERTAGTVKKPKIIIEGFESLDRSI